MCNIFIATTLKLFGEREHQIMKHSIFTINVSDIGKNITRVLSLIVVIKCNCYIYISCKKNGCILY